MYHDFPMVQVDVFTAVPLQGNALSVVTESRGLHIDEMHALARETNLSETAFIIRSDVATERVAGIRVRIFTTQEELPFAGHPTLGAAWVIREELAASGKKPSEITLSLNVGKVPVRFVDEGPDGGTFGEMTQVDPTFGPVHDRAAVAEALGLPEAALDPALPVQTVSTGLPFTIVPLRDLAAAQGLAVDVPKASAWLAANGGGRFFYFVTRETVDPAARLHARMLFYGGEDPATGSAAGCAAAWAVAHGVAKPEERFLIEQGLEMKRPSRLHVRAGKRGDQVVNVRVGGSVVRVLKGTWTLG